MQPNSLSLPKYFPAPRLVYIVKGRGVLGMTYPGCPQTYHSEQPFTRGQSQRKGDEHQKVYRVRQGDIIAIPAGLAHWCYNDGNEELVAVSVMHLNNKANQLDQNLRAFMLAGGQPREGRQQHQETKLAERMEQTFQNVFRAMDQQMMAEAFNIPTEMARQMQQEDNRGIIVKCEREMKIMMPEEEMEGERYNEAIPNEQNGVEETFCTMRVKQNIDCHRQADVYTRQAGSIRIANDLKLPILRYLGMSAEKGHLEPNAMYTPDWSMTDQRVVYAIRGELHVQIVDDNGNNIMNEMVKQGDMFVLPQFYATMARAGNEGFEWITFKTSSRPMNSPMAGVTSVMRAMPIDVLTNSYQMSPREAEQVKMNRDPQSMLLFPTRTSS